MKNLQQLILCILATLFWTQTNAQSFKMSQIQQELNSMFSELDTSKYRKTNLFLNGSIYYPLIDRMSSEDTIEAFDKRQWYEAANSIHIKYPKAIDSIELIYKKAGEYLKNGITPMMMLNYAFDDIHTNAFDSGLLDTSNGKFHLTRDETPFVQRDLEAIAPGMQFHYKSPKIIFPSNLYFTNKESTLPTIKIQINDGPQHDVQWDKIFELELLTEYENASDLTTINVFVSQPFKKGILKFVVKHNNGTWESLSNLADGYIDSNVLKSHTSIGPQAMGYASIKFGYDQNGKKHDCISKPLIIVEGIDFGTPENPTGCFDGKCGTLGWIDILTGVNPDYPQLKNGPHFVDLLQKKGYDIIYLDWWDGATYMEDNAMVLVKLIQEINRIKCTDEELVVCGVSMGGQVAKYALSYMESKGWPHCTRTYVSFDSPHQGANIPIALQQFTSLMASASAEAEWSLRSKIQRPATRQLLINHVDVPGSGTDGLRSQFLVNLKEVGNYPNATRNVAIINGSGKKVGMGFNAGDSILSWHSEFILHKSPSLQIIPVHIHATFFASCGLQPDNITLGIDFKKFNQRIKGYKYAPILCNALDNVPGGTRSDIFGLTEPKHGPEMVLGVPEAYIKTECFIPSISALDVNTSNYWLNIENSIDKTQSNTITPFEEIYYPELNQPHVYLEYQKLDPENPNLSNVGWFITEIEKTQELLIPKSLTGYYNFINVRLKGITIESGAILRINKFDFSGNGSLNKPKEGEHIVVQTAQCNGEIRVKSGATLVIGDNNTPTANTADLSITTLSKLILESGSKLIIHDGSKLIIETGAILEFHPNAQILLEGENSELQIRGELKLHQAAFKVGCSPNLKMGFVSFYLGGMNSGINSFGPNSSIELVGQSTSISHHRIMEVHGGNLIIPGIRQNSSHYLNKFKVHNATIRYYNNASIEPKCLVDMDNVALIGSKNTESTGLILNGNYQKLLENIQFYTLGKGIHYSNLISNVDVELKSCRFYRCTIGIQSSGGKFQLVNCSFSQNQSGFLAQKVFGFISFKQSSFYQNEIGLQLESILTNNTFIENCNFAQNETGILSFSPGYINVTVKCSQFINNKLGIDLTGQLNISSSITVLNNTGGHNAFYANQRAIDVKGELFLANGFNLFIAVPNISLNPYVLAHVKPCTGCSQFTTSGSILMSQNYWSPSYSLDLRNSQYPSQSYAVLGDFLSSPSNSCFTTSTEGIPQFIGTESWAVQLEKNQAPVNAYKATADIAKPYPNPSRDLIIVDGKSSSYSISNVSGSSILKGSFEQNESRSIDLSQLVPGLYVLKIRVESNVYSYKIIKF